MAGRSSLRRGRQLIAPYGQTVLRAGDVLVTVMDGDDNAAWRRLCQLPD